MSAPGRSWAGLQPATVILFDLDDTILDFSGGADFCWRAVCAEASAQRPELSAGPLRTAIAETAAVFWSDPGRHRAGRLDLRAATAAIVGQALRGSGVADPAMARRMADRYRDLREEHLALLPGAEETLICLRREGFRLGLVSNGDAVGQRSKVDRFGLARYFSYIGIEGEVGVGKPDPAAYRAALRALGCAPGSAWMVGDNFEWDVAAPQRLGLRAVWVDPRGQRAPDGAPGGADHVVAGIAELIHAES